MKSPENLTVSDYIDIFRRRIWYVVVTAVLSVIGTIAYVRQMPSIYKSETTIAVTTRLIPEDYIRSIDRQTNSDRMDSVRQELQSRAFLEGIVHEFNLAGPGSEGMELAFAMVGSKIEVTVLTPSAFKLGFSSTDPKLAQALTARLAERVIQLNNSFRKEKTQTANQFLDDQLLEAGNELSKTEQKLSEFRNRAFPGMPSETPTADSIRDLQAQLATLETRLEAAVGLRKSLERRLQENRELKVALKSVPVRTETPAASVAVAVAAPSPLEVQLANKRAELAAAKIRYTSLHPEIVRLTRETQELEVLVRQSKPVQSSAPAIASQENKGESAPFPELDASIDLIPAEIQAELEQVNRDIAKIEPAKSAVSAKLSAYQARFSPPPALAQEFAQLTRENDVARQRYTTLSNTKMSSEMAARVDSSESNELFKVMDTAFLPQKPIGPNRRLLALLGSLGGLVLGFGTAFLRDYLDPSLQTEEDVLTELRLPVLTSIPTVAEDRKGRIDKNSDQRILQKSGDGQENSATFSLRRADSRVRNVVLNPRSVAGEHYRLLYTLLSAMKTQRPIKKILVSSASPNEGKTFSACCLAGILAQDPAKKVLLIDGDLRKSGAAELLGLKSRKPQKSLQAVLRGEASLEESVLRCSVTNLYFLPNDTMASSPLELLSSPELQYLLQHGTEGFDWVIVDTAPILATADTGLILPFCDGVLFVVKASSTSVKLIKESIKRVGQEHILGVLLNGVKDNRASYYHYGDYYQPTNQAKSKSKLRDTV